MMDTLEARDFQTRLERLDELLRQAAQFADPAAKSCLQDIVQTLLELHGVGIERLVECLARNGDDAIAECVADDVVAGMLLLHGLHPLDLEGRVRQALDSVRPYLQSHGGNVELVSIDDGTVRLALHGSCHHCSSSTVTMQQTIEVAIHGKAPEVTSIEIDGIAESAPEASEGRVALPLLAT